MLERPAVSAGTLAQLPEWPAMEPTSVQLVGHPYDETAVFLVGVAVEAARLGDARLAELLSRLMRGEDGDDQQH
jgi:hypothetical protein